MGLLPVIDDPTRGGDASDPLLADNWLYSRAMVLKRSAGRPPRERERHAYLPALEYPLRDLLWEAAARAELPVSVTASIIIGDAYGYHSPWEPDLDYQALGIDIDRARAVGATPPQPFPIVDSDKKKTYMRLDRELADRINARCEAHAVAHVEELRRILAAAFGMDRPDLVRFVQRHGHQDALPIAEAS